MDHFTGVCSDCVSGFRYSVEVCFYKTCKFVILCESMKQKRTKNIRFRKPKIDGLCLKYKYKYLEREITPVLRLRVIVNENLEKTKSSVLLVLSVILIHLCCILFISLCLWRWREAPDVTSLRYADTTLKDLLGRPSFHYADQTSAMQTQPLKIC